MAVEAYRQLLAMSAFIARGNPVALPLAGQPCWDFLADEAGAWKRVEVRSADGAFKYIWRKHSGWHTLYTHDQLETRLLANQHTPFGPRCCSRRSLELSSMGTGYSTRALCRAI